jgi:hypothetical protein
LWGNVAIDASAHVPDILGQALAAAVVIHHHLQEVGVFRKLREILLGAVNRTE